MAENHHGTCHGMVGTCWNMLELIDEKTGLCPGYVTSVGPKNMGEKTDISAADTGKGIRDSS